MYKFKTKDAYVSILCFSLCSLLCRVFHNAFNKLSLIWAVWMQWTPKVKILCKIHNLAQNKQGANLSSSQWAAIHQISLNQFEHNESSNFVCLLLWMSFLSHNSCRNDANDQRLAQLLKIYLNHSYIMHLQNPDVYCCAIFLSNISCSNLAKGEFTELLSITHQNVMPSHTVH